MRITSLIVGAVSCAVIATVAFAQTGSNDDSALTRKRYLPEYTARGRSAAAEEFQ